MSKDAGALNSQLIFNNELKQEDGALHLYELFGISVKTCVEIVI